MYQDRMSTVCKGATSDRKPSVVRMEDDEETRKKIMTKMKKMQHHKTRQFAGRVGCEK